MVKRASTRRMLVAALSKAGSDSLLSDFLSTIDRKRRTTDEWRLLVEVEGRRGEILLATRAVRWLTDTGASEMPTAIAGDDRFWGKVAANLLAAAEFSQALSAVDRAIAMAPENVVYLNNRVVLLTKLGRESEAAMVWERVLALDPSLARQSP